MPIGIKLLTTLNDADQRGGAYLRVHALEQIYQKLGLNPKICYHGQLKTKKKLSGLFRSIWWGKNVQTLFPKHEWENDSEGFLHLDNLKFFSWNIKNRSKSKLIYNAHNLEFESYFDRALNEPGADQLRDYECKQIGKSDITFVCSEREKQKLLSINSNLAKKVYVIPNLVNKDQYLNHCEKDTILFLGTLDYYPNVHAVRYLCHKFMPRIPKELKDQYRFVIAGRSPLPEQVDLVKSSGFELMTDLSDEEVRNLLGRTLVSLVPLTHGSGTRLKIIESIFSGAKVLSTGLGAEGITSPDITTCTLDNFRGEFIKLMAHDRLNRPNELGQFSSEFDLDTWYGLHEKELKELLGLSK